MATVASILGDDQVVQSRVDHPWKVSKSWEGDSPRFTPPQGEMDDPFDDFEDDDFDDEFDDDFEEDWEDDLTEDDEFPDNFGGDEKKKEKESPFKGDPDFDDA